jgi:hypothetical protein
VVVRIGVIHTGKELELELADDTDREALQRQIEESVAAGGGLLWLTDRRGRRVGVPADRIAWVELGEDASARRVGFSATA